MEFLTIFGKVVAKNKVFENNTIFYNNFSPISGGAERSPPPLAEPVMWILLIRTYLCFPTPAKFPESFAKKPREMKYLFKFS